MPITTTDPATTTVNWNDYLGCLVVESPHSYPPNSFTFSHFYPEPNRNGTIPWTTVESRVARHFSRRRLQDVDW